MEQNNYYAPNNGATPPQPPRHTDPFSSDRFGKSRGVCALLAIFLGSFGVQYFYLGKNTAGIIALVATWVLCGIPGILWFIQGILMLLMPADEFERKYETTTSTFPLF
jgi:TM2 domain-containing membrane protein YozV